MVRIDVLAEQIDFQAAFAGQSTSLLQNVFNRARIFGSPGIGNDAVGTEIVAAFLNGQKSAGAGAVILGQKVKFGFGRKFGIDDCLAFLPPDPFKNFGQAVVCQRAGGKINKRSPFGDLLVLGLNNATDYADNHVFAGSKAFFADEVEPPQV